MGSLYDGYLITAVSCVNYKIAASCYQVRCLFNYISDPLYMLYIYNNIYILYIYCFMHYVYNIDIKTLLDLVNLIVY